MDRIKELHQILKLIKKHDLPLSPILEYAIKEREMQYSELPASIESLLPTAKSFEMQRKKLIDYVVEFASLSVAVSKGKKLPHKAILLLGIMGLIEKGVLIGNVIPLDNIVVEAFVTTWSRYFDSKAPSVWIPFYHLKGEGFWHFKPMESSERLNMMLSFGGTPSIGKMRPVIKYAFFDDALYGYMINDRSRGILKKVLIDNYLS